MIQSGKKNLCFFQDGLQSKFKKTAGQRRDTTLHFEWHKNSCMLRAISTLKNFFFSGVGR